MRFWKYLALLLLINTSCSPEKEIQTPDLVHYLFYEDFLKNSENGAVIHLTGWTDYVQVGTVKWKQGIYNGAKYAEFTSYKSGQASNIAWLISPPIDMDKYENEKLTFDVAQAYVSSAANALDVFVSSDYNGSNVTTATWTALTFTKPPLVYESNFQFFSSGIIDLSKYAGKICIAFKVTGSGTKTTLDGTYEIDNIRVFDKK